MKTIVLLAVAFVACTPAPTAPVPDSGDASAPTPENACANMRAQGCEAGSDPRCAALLAQVIDAGLTPVDVACLVKAQSKAAVRACGFVSCQ